MDSINRRTFIKSAGTVAALGAAGVGTALADEAATGKVATDTEGVWAFEIPPAPIPDDQIVATYDAQVVVIGSGVAGLVCGARLSEELGDKVMLVSAGHGPVSRGGSNHGIGTKTLLEEGLGTAPRCCRFCRATPSRLPAPAPMARPRPRRWLPRCSSA